MKHAFRLIAALVFSTSLSFQASAAEVVAKPGANSGAKADAAAPMSSGQVKKIDRDTGKITIKHGPLINVDMPAMTMSFLVKHPSMLDQVKVGDKIDFVAEKSQAGLTVTKLTRTN